MIYSFRNLYETAERKIFKLKVLKYSLSSPTLLEKIKNKINKNVFGLISQTTKTKKLLIREK